MYQLTFAAACPEVVRENIREAMDAVKSPRRAPRVKPARARALIEAAGSRAIAEPDRVAGSAARKWLVRIYYVSAGGELLCFDAGPFVDVVASRVASEHAARQVYVPSKSRKPRKTSEMYRDEDGAVPSAEKFDRDEVGADAIAQGRYRSPNHGARLVVLPSQQHKQVEPVVDSSAGGES